MPMILHPSNWGGPTGVCEEHRTLVAGAYNRVVQEMAEHNRDFHAEPDPEEMAGDYLDSLEAWQTYGPDA